MHHAGVVHLDIKPDNILLNNHTGVAKICDTGLATWLVRGQMDGCCGTDAYMAPEVRARSYDGRLADAWSLGAALYFNLTGMPPCESPVMADDGYRQIIRVVYKAGQYITR
ncbi:unnamed protein product, partial [Mesorhabditis spiculigera]